MGAVDHRLIRTLPEALVALDDLIDEAARLRAEVALLRSERDTWRSRAEYRP